MIHNFKKYPDYTRPSRSKAYGNVVGGAMWVVQYCYKKAFTESKLIQN